MTIKQLQNPKVYAGIKFRLDHTKRESLVIATGPKVLDVMPAFKKTNLDKKRKVCYNSKT
jgi:hypothetical protein